MPSAENVATGSFRFRYKAVDAAGALQSGGLVCASRAEAMEQLYQRHLMPIEVTESGTPRSNWRRELAGLFDRGQRLTSWELLSFTKSMAALLKAGLTVDRALALAGQMTEREAVKAQFLELTRAVRAGRSFADALAGSHIALPPYYMSMIQAGEVGGSLPQTLSRLAELLRRQVDLRERLRSALVYPALLAGVVLVTMIILLTFVLPRFEALFAESDTELPLSTQVVLAAGHVAADYWWLFALVAAGVVIGALKIVRSPAGALRLDRWLLNSRVVFNLPRSLNTARFFQTLGVLLANGVALASALRIARGTVANRVLQQAIDDVARRVKAGESMTKALLDVGVFPVHAVQLLRVGEEIGRLEQMLLDAADILEEESQRRLERLLTLLVPVITIGMGLMVAGLIASVLVGLLSINELAM